MSTIVEIGDLAYRDYPQVIDACGHAVVPGFTDHHLHLHAMASADSSVRCGPPHVTDGEALRAAVRSADPDSSGWVRGVGYTETVAGDLDRRSLDCIESNRPLRVQHRSGAMWMLNSAALHIVGAGRDPHPGIERDAAGAPTGRIWRADDWLRSRLPPTAPPDLAAVGDRLLRFGIVEVTDASPDLDDTAVSHIVDAVDSGRLRGRVHLLGVRLGSRITHPQVTSGPYKIVITDSALPDLEELVDLIRHAHESDRSVAVHCISAVSLALLTAAWVEAGVRPGDRIEHAGVVPAEYCERLGAFGVQVVTQPGFLSDRGDEFLDGSEAREHDDLYRCGSLIDAGVPVALSSDAPYGPLNPWHTIDAAVNRLTRSGRRVGRSEERLAVSDALHRHQTPATSPAGAARSISVGGPADLVIADRSFAEMLETPGETRTTLTMINGQPFPGSR